MICVACGTQNDPDRKFCLECGARLSMVCPSCGSPNPPGKFCGECGSALAGGATTSEVSPAAEAAPRSTERRLVSVLFLDLVSFTTLSERRDAEDIRSLMDAYFETARTVIERHGGVVEKFMGTRSWRCGGRRSRTRTTPNERFVPAPSSCTRWPRSAPRWIFRCRPAATC